MAHFFIPVVDSQPSSTPCQIVQVLAGQALVQTPDSKIRLGTTFALSDAGDLVCVSQAPIGRSQVMVNHPESHYFVLPDLFLKGERVDKQDVKDVLLAILRAAVQSVRATLPKST